MKFKYDTFGWYGGHAAPGELERTTEVGPGNVGAQPVEGEPWPNWDGTAWIAVPYAPPPEQPDPEPVEDPRLWWVDVGPFYDRFGVDALAIAASDHGACKAVQTLTGVRKYIDLRDPRVDSMIDMLIATAQPAAQAWAPGSGPMTADKKAAILNTPTTEYERHIKGLEG